MKKDLFRVTMFVQYGYKPVHEHTNTNEIDDFANGVDRWTKEKRFMKL